MRRLFQGIRKVHGKQLRPPREHVTLDLLQTLCTLCNNNSFDELCIKTALCVAYAGFLRGQDFTYSNWGPSEQLSKPTRSSIKFYSDHATLHLPITKTDQLRHGTTVLLTGTDSPSCPVKNLQNLFAKYPAPDDAPLFARLHPLAAYEGVCFSSQYFTTSLKTLLLRAGVDPTRFTGHSLRRGAAQSAVEFGLNKEDIQSLGRWRSDTILRYIKPESVPILTKTKPPKDTTTLDRCRHVTKY